MSDEEVEDIVIDLLAAQHKVDAAALREDLDQKGLDWPIDSIVLVQVLVAVEKRCGVRVTPDEESARTLRSVRAFARLVAAMSRKDG